MTTPDGPGSDTAQLIRSIVDNAKRYGLMWQMVMASVVDGSDAGDVAVQFDGDQTVTPGAVSMIGFLEQGDRVYLIQVPPAGNYIIGRANGPYRARKTLTASAASVHFGPIPANLRNLTIRMKSRSSGVGAAIGVAMQINADTSAAYSIQIGRSNNVTTTAIPFAAGALNGIIGLATGSSAAAGVFGSGIVEFEGWDLTGQSLGWEYSATAMGVGVANFFHDAGGGMYSGLVARTSIDIFPSSGAFQAGSDFQLYGEPS